MFNPINELQTGYSGQYKNIQSHIITHLWTNPTMKFITLCRVVEELIRYAWSKANKEASFINFINPWNQEGQSTAIGFQLPHIPHFAIWGRDLESFCLQSTWCSSLQKGSFACLVVFSTLWCHLGGLTNSSSRHLYMIWFQTQHLPFCHLC